MVSLLHAYVNPNVDLGTDKTGADEWNAEHILKLDGPALLGNPFGTMGGDAVEIPLGDGLGFDEYGNLVVTNPVSNASDVVFDPTGLAIITGEDVQTALAELDAYVATLDLVALGDANTWTALQTFSLAGVPARFVNTSDSASVQVAKFEGDRATMADNDAAYLSFLLSNDAGTQVELGRWGWRATDVNVATNIDAQLFWSVMSADVLSEVMRLNGTALSPAANDGLALGRSGLLFSDLLLATGGVISFNETDWVGTHSSGILTVNPGDIRITTPGTNSASVVTVGGAQTLTSKTLTSPTLTTPVLGTPSSGTLSNCDAASTSAKGVVELATAAEFWAGTDTARVPSVDEFWNAAETVTLSDAATISVDCATFLTSCACTLGGNRTLGNPTNDKVGQCFFIQFQATGSTRTLTLDSQYFVVSGVEIGPYSVTTSQSLYVCGIILSSTVAVVTGVFRIG